MPCDGTMLYGEQCTIMCARKGEIHAQETIRYISCRCMRWRGLSDKPRCPTARAATRQPDGEAMVGIQGGSGPRYGCHGDSEARSLAGGSEPVLRAGPAEARGAATGEGTAAGSTADARADEDF